MVDTKKFASHNIFLCTYFHFFDIIQLIIYCGRKCVMAEKSRIKLNINGKTYTLLHDEPEDYMRRIEHFLNTRVSAASKSGIQLGEQTAVIMASISIVDELFKTQKNFNTLKNEIKRMMDEYDRLKLEKQELDDQLTNAENQIEKLNKQLIIAKQGY